MKSPPPQKKNKAQNYPILYSMTPHGYQQLRPKTLLLLLLLLLLNSHLITCFFNSGMANYKTSTTYTQQKCTRANPNNKQQFCHSSAVLCTVNRTMLR
jgi:hypothetical protein